MVQEVEKSFSNQKVASLIPCRSVLDTEPLIAPDVQCAISVNVKCVYILVRRSKDTPPAQWLDLGIPTSGWLQEQLIGLIEPEVAVPHFHERRTG